MTDGHVLGALYADPRAMLESTGRETLEAGWPVSDTEFRVISDAVFDLFLGLIDTAEAGQCDLLLIDTRFVVLLIQHVHALLVVARCRANGVLLRRSPQSEPYYAPDWNRLASDYRNLPQALRSQLRRRLTPAIKRILYNKIRIGRRGLHALRHGFDALALGSDSRLRRLFLEENELFCDFPNADDLVAGAATGSDGGGAWHGRLKEALDGLSRRLQDELGVAVDVTAVSGAWAQRLGDIEAAVDNVAVGKIPPRVLIGELGNPRHRIFAVACRRAGADVVGFHHGNSAQHYLSKWFGLIEPAICTEFICPTVEIARSCRSSFDLSGLQRHLSVSFGAVAKSPYAALHVQLSRVRPPKAIKKVMIVGFPCTAQRYLDSPADFFGCQFGVERRVSELLRQSGYTVLYKAHPEHAATAGALQRGAADNIIVAPFEDVWPMADAYVFCCTTSTTFGHALLTSRPVVVLDIEGASWNPDVYASLKSRCQLIPAYFDERNCVQFDANRMRSALSEGSGAADPGYVSKFML